MLISPKTADTLEGNAMLKAEYIYKNYGLDCFADDTGLEVESFEWCAGCLFRPLCRRRRTQCGSQYAKIIAEYAGSAK